MISKNWREACLSEVCEINPGKRALSDTDKEMEISFLPMASVSEEGRILTQEKRKLREVIKGYTNFQDGDVLLAKITPCFENGKRAIARNLINGIGFGSTEFHVLRPKNEVTSDWIFYAISRSDFCNIAKSQMTGTAGQKRVPARVLEQFRIPVPPVSQQKAIADNIETQFTRLNAAIKSLKAIKIKVELYRKSVLNAAFTGKLVDVVEWEETKVGDLGEIVTGTTPSKSKAEYYGNKYCFFKPTDLNAGYYVKKSHDMLSAKGVERARLLPERSILVTCIGATIGKTGFNRVEGATNQQINSVISDQSKYVPELLYYLFVSDRMQRQIKDNSSSTTLPILNKSKFSGLRVRIPRRKEEQSEIVNKIESYFSVIGKLAELVDASLIKAEKLRKSILKSAFEGKLVN